MKRVTVYGLVAIVLVLLMAKVVCAFGSSCEMLTSLADPWADKRDTDESGSAERVVHTQTTSRKSIAGCNCAI